MIAVDSSTVIAYIQGDSGIDVQLLETCIGSNELVLPPVVLAEVLSDPKLPSTHSSLMRSLPLLEITEDFWSRAAISRSKVLARKLRAPLADALIAQSCIDHGVPLITRDADFRHFAKHCGLKLA